MYVLIYRIYEFSGEIYVVGKKLITIIKPYYLLYYIMRETLKKIFIFFTFLVITLNFSLVVDQNGLDELVVVEKGANITEEMEVGIRKSIKDSALNCTDNDRSCFAQIIGLKIQALYGKSWNVHLLEKTTTAIKGRQYSHDRWITLVNEGDPAYSYYIFKPIDCSKPISPGTQNSALKLTEIDQQKQYWGSSMTQSLKNRVKTIIEDAYKQSESLDSNAQYIQNKLGPGRWEVIVWNTPSFDYVNTCMYASYFGLLVGIQRGNMVWSYYVGRMSLI